MFIESAVKKYYTSNNCLRGTIPDKNASTVEINMAYLLNSKSYSHCYLLSHHSFGRLAYSVNTLLTSPEISKIHAIVEWDGTEWILRDISTNGSWLNNVRLIDNKKYVLSINDRIYFGERGCDYFEVLDLSPPCDILVSGTKERKTHKVISLNNYSILPSDSEPEVVLYQNQQTRQWYKEKISDSNHKGQLLEDNDIISFSGRDWHLKLNNIDVATENLGANQLNIGDLEFNFFCSLDEENIELKINTPARTSELGIRIHHYLTMSLARIRAQDAEQGLDELSQGWIYTEQLACNLGIDISHLNIQIHRARKQFITSLDSVINSNTLIQRRPGELRFGGGFFKIYKGKNLECHLKNKINNTLTEKY